MTNICHICRKQIVEGDKYACLWGQGKDGLYVTFICMECSERPDVEDITGELKGERTAATPTEP